MVVTIAMATTDGNYYSNNNGSVNGIGALISDNW